MSGEPIRSSQKNNGEGCVGTLMWSDLSGEQWKSLSSILLGLKKKKKKKKWLSITVHEACTSTSYQAWLTKGFPALCLDAGLTWLPEVSVG